MDSVGGQVSIPHWLRLSYSPIDRMAQADRDLVSIPHWLRLSYSQIVIGIILPMMFGFNPTLATTQLLTY